MHIPAEFIRPFPEPKDVFATEIERHAKHFLPICSLNLQFIHPESEAFWVHFVQPAEIYEGCVGEHTAEFHDRFNFDDSIGFDVDENGKYRFNGDWKFFVLENDSMPPEQEAAIRQQAAKIAEKQNISLEKAIAYKTPHIYKKETKEELDNVYRINHLSYQAIKSIYQKYKDIFHVYVPLDLDSPYTSEELEKLKIEAQEKSQNHEPSHKPNHELLQDAGGLSEGMQEQMQEDGIQHIDELFQEEYGNLFDTPKRDDGKVFSYIGWLSGYQFQEYGCDELYLFFDQESGKAVIRLVYS